MPGYPLQNHASGVSVAVMHISPEGEIGIFLALLALLGSGAIMRFPTRLWIGSTMIALSIVGFIILAFQHFGVWQMRTVPGFGMIISAAVFLVCGAWYFWPSAPEEKLPGFAAYAVLRIYDVPEFHRKYIFDFGSADGKSRAAFYLSASDQFTFLLTDIRGESYPLEIKLGHGGIPIDKFIMLICEAGVDEGSTVLRVSVNGKEIQRRKLAFQVNLGERKWGPGTTVGANAIGQSNGVLMLMELGAYADTFSKDEVSKMLKNVMDFYKLKMD